ncbi:MAG: hypothetical protein GY732_20945 [Gammaproteobacteria bacterium]|nr:hypothetical protein [Gammaproteobacteria bacterium]
MRALSTAINNVVRLWRGELTLQVAFWNWAVLGGLVINLASSALFLLLILNDQLIAAFIIGYGFSLPYNFLVLVGVWRSAEQYTGDQRWAELAKITTAIAMVLFSIT